jgi:hypothetical protein
MQVSIYAHQARPVIFAQFNSSHLTPVPLNTKHCTGVPHVRDNKMPVEAHNHRRNRTAHIPRHQAAASTPRGGGSNACVIQGGERVAKTPHQTLRWPRCHDIVLRFSPPHKSKLMPPKIQKKIEP